MTYRDKKDFLTHLPKILTTHANTHTILFSTFTFKIPHRKNFDFETSKEYFSTLRKKLDLSLLSDRKKFENRPILLLFPEKSKANTPDHFHGFMLIHNSTLKKFYKNCVSTVKKEPIKKLDNVLHDTVYLKNFMLDASTLKAPKSFRSTMSYNGKVTLLNAYREIPAHRRSPHAKQALAHADSFLTIHEYKLHIISDIDEFHKTAFYSAKNFISSAPDYILETKYNSNKK